MSVFRPKLCLASSPFRRTSPSPSKARLSSLENSLNTDQARREAVALWLSEAAAIAPDETDLSVRTAELVAKGFKSFDAFHLASAELSGAAAFLTVDLQILKLASRVSDELNVPVTDPVAFIEEISQWKH